MHNKIYLPDNPRGNVGYIYVMNNMSNLRYISLNLFYKNGVSIVVGFTLLYIAPIFDL